MNYQSGMNGTLEKNRICNQQWRNTLTIAPLMASASTSSYFVALIVLLRFLMIKRPMYFEDVHKVVTRVGCITIWVVVLLICFITFLVSLPSVSDRSVYRILNTYIENIGLLGAPMLLTVIFYAMLLCTLNPETAVSSATSVQMRELVKMTYGIVIGLLVFNVPGLIYTAIMGFSGFDMKSSTAVIFLTRQPFKNIRNRILFYNFG